MGLISATGGKKGPTGGRESTSVTRTGTEGDDQQWGGRAGPSSEQWGALSWVGRRGTHRGKVGVCAAPMIKLQVLSRKSRKKGGNR